jgi:hypothetical protein
LNVQIKVNSNIPEKQLNLDSKKTVSLQKNLDTDSSFKKLFK